MTDTRLCPACNRSLQQNRENCIYCGYSPEKATEEFQSNKISEDNTEMLLRENEKQLISERGKLIAKILVTILSILAASFLSWMAEWHLIIVVLALIFFSMPIWHIWKKL